MRMFSVWVRCTSAAAAGDHRSGSTPESCRGGSSSAAAKVNQPSATVRACWVTRICPRSAPPGNHTTGAGSSSHMLRKVAEPCNRPW
jgi:hypothetical protein